MRRNREEWKRLIGEFRGGNQSLREFAEQRGIRADTLSWWTWRLGAEARKKTPQRRRPRTSIKFIPVDVAAATGAAGSVEIGLADLTIRFPSGAAPEYVGAVMLELKALC